MEVQEGKEIMDKEQVAVIILNYKSWKDTLQEAQLVHDLFHLRWEQIIIIDNASPNESKDELEKKAIGNYVFIETGENNGYASGNNVGLRYAYEKGYKFGWILNNDIIIEDENVLEELLRIFSIDKSIAVVNPDVYSPTGYLFNRNSKRRSFWDYTLGYVSYKKKGRHLNLLDGYGYIWRPQGCCMMVDLGKMNEIGYLDENTFLYCEEPILGEKILKAGYRAACACEVEVIHNHSTTVKSVLQKEEIIKTHNRSFEYYLCSYRGFNRLQVKLCLMVATLEMRIKG